MSRIGVTQRVSVVEDYGERRDCLDQAWTGVLEDHGLVPVPLANTVSDVAGYLGELELDGLVLTGGNDLESVEDPGQPAPERDRFERAALEVARERGWPVLGVCRGLQLVIEVYGGSLESVEGHVATSHEVAFEGWLGLESASVNSYHDYGIPASEVGEELEVVGVAADGTIEAVRHPEWDLVAVMWHPERDERTSVDDRVLEAVFGGRGS